MHYADTHVLLVSAPLHSEVTVQEKNVRNEERPWSSHPHLPNVEHRDFVSSLNEQARVSRPHLTRAHNDNVVLRVRCLYSLSIEAGMEKDKRAHRSTPGHGEGRQRLCLRTFSERSRGLALPAGLLEVDVGVRRAERHDISGVCERGILE